MELISLDQVFRILRPGVPLPFGVRDSQGRLLLARGHVLATQEKVIELLNRSMFVDANEARASLGAAGAGEARRRPTASFSARWEALIRRLGLLLREPQQAAFLPQLAEVTAQIAGFPEHESDQILFLILRHDYTRYEIYAESHALHVAALCHLISRRLGWPATRRDSLINAALTMNLSIANLQARLATHAGPISMVQRKEIEAHPQASAIMLRAIGVTDADWLRAVEQHHESPGGHGYPLKLLQPDEMSQVIRLCDVFAAKHSPRMGRTPQPPHVAARRLYEQEPGNPVAAALIKECGIYPPGSYVRLASGELAIVTRRGASAKQPQVAVIVNPAGEALLRPTPRDSADPARAIVATVPEKAIKVHHTAERLYA